MICMGLWLMDEVCFDNWQSTVRPCRLRVSRRAANKSVAMLPVFEILVVSCEQIS